MDLRFESVACRKDGSFALASSALTGRVWDGNLWVFKSLKEYHECPNLFLTNTRTSDGISDFVWVDDNESRLLVASDSGELEVWSCTAIGGGLEQTGCLRAHDDMALCLGRLGGGGVEGVVSGGADMRVILWDMTTEKQISNYKGHMSMVLAVACDPNSEMFVTASQDNSVRLWDTRLPKPARDLQACKNGIYTSVAWSSESLALGNERGSVEVFDPRNDHYQLASYRHHSAAVTRLAFHPLQPNVLASTSDDCQVLVQSLSSNETMYKHSGHTDFVRGVSWDVSDTESGCGLLTCGWDGKLFRHELPELMSK